MISKHEISSGAGAASYFSNSFSKDAGQQTDNYYVNEQAQSTWQGKGAQILGVAGQRVTREDFVAFLDGKFLNPTTGEVQDLSKNSNGAQRRAGWDFTISAPKSVSIVGLVGGDVRVLQAHQSANAAAMAWLEQHGAQIRVKDGQGNNLKVGTGNLIYATVSHETSRDNEPQIHNHNVIVAATYDLARDTWRSLTNDELFKIRADGDVIYKAALAHALRKAGYELEYTKDGVNFEIKGLDAQQLETFSSRTKTIDAALQARGFDPQSASWAARQAAALDTRSKKVELAREVLHEVWQETARGAGLDVSHLVDAAMARSATPEFAHRLSQAEGQDALRSVSWAVEHLSTREQSFTLAELEKTVVEFGQVTLAAAQEAIRAHTKNQLLVVRDEVQDGMTLMTTMKGITAERQMQANIQAGIGVGKVVLTSEAEFTARLQAFEAQKSQSMGVDYQLTGEQIAAAHNMLMHPDAYQAVQGDAGTGKTAALEFVREVAQSKGWLVRGVAVSASAAQELQAGSGIESQTLARMFAERETAARLLQLEITALRAEIAKLQSPGDGAQREGAAMETPPRIEVQKLQARSADIDFGQNRYTFDHAKGEVFKGTGGLQAKMAEYLLELSARLRAGEAPQSRSRSMGVKLHMQRPSEQGTTQGIDGVAQSAAHSVAQSSAQSAVHGLTHRVAKTAGAWGEALMRYQKVGTVEAIAARNALYAFKADAQERLTSALRTRQAELTNLTTRGNTVGANTLLVMDESSMGGVHDMVKYSAMANALGARVVIQGDEKQHGSVLAGRAFVQIKQAGTKVSTLEQTRRFDKATAQTKDALALMTLGQYGQAMTKLDTRQVLDADLASAVGKRFIENYEELKARGIEVPKVGVVTVTNNDRKAINITVQTQMRAKGYVAAERFRKDHLDDPKLTPAQQRTVSKLAKASVDRLIFRKDYKEIGVNRGDVLVVTGMDIAANRITVQNAAGLEVRVNPDWHDYFSAAKAETREYSVGDRVEARAIVRADGQEIKNGTRGRVVAVNDRHTSIRWDHGQDTVLDNGQVRFVDLAYAHTSYKEQGATNDREIIAISKVGAKVFNQMAAYVSATRAKDNTEIVTSDLPTLIKNADKLALKTVATDISKADAASAKIEHQESFEAAIGRLLREHQSLRKDMGLEGNEKPLQRSGGQDKEQSRDMGIVQQAASQRDLGLSP